MKHEEAFYIGYITKTRGLKGELQLFFEFDAYDQIHFEVVYIDINRQLVPYFVSAAKLQSNKTGYFQFEDVNDIDAASALVKKKVYLPLSQKPTRQEGSFFYTDLKGFTAVDQTLGSLGQITAINEYPQQFVATVLYQNKEVLFPLNEDFIIQIDEKENVLTLDLPDGLLDIYLT